MRGQNRLKLVTRCRSGANYDQLIVLEHSDNADLAMRIYNADGSEVEACGNASRCVVALIGKDVSIQTAGGLISGKLSDGGVTIDMGQPTFEWDEIPLGFAMDSRAMPLAWDELASPMAVNVGNPHVVFFVPDCDAVDLERLGPIIEHDVAFPERVNVNVASIQDGAVKLRVWERGVGETLACGTGACATAVAAICRGHVKSPVTVHLPGGPLTIEWANGQPIIMTGGTSNVFKGSADWDKFG